MSYWWSNRASENCWVEIRKADGLGLSLWSPDRQEGGRKDPWYELVASVRRGDVVYHYNANQSKFVGWSIAAADAVHSVRESSYSVDLVGFTPFTDVVDLAVFRSKADALYAERDRLAALHPGQPLYLPFQFTQDRSQVRMMSNYFTKLPRSFVDILFGSRVSSAATELASSPGADASVARIPRGYLQPFRAKADTDYLTNVLQDRSRRTRSHETLVNSFAVWLSKHNRIPLRNAAVDLGTENPSTVIEAKRVNGNFADAIRAAVGQLYEYRYFKVTDRDSGLIFLADEPVPAPWCEYLERDRRIGVIWHANGRFYLQPLARKFLGLDRT
ncbi:hypothetical protein ACW9HK_19640 [Nocardia gipuzkoensis]|uniref:hypothetical protein n=1 Tax=Nocardia TaxID=1817 RepID=UPI0024580C70|nr:MULTISPECIES: hypothetical protein [Nocardia]